MASIDSELKGILWLHLFSLHTHQPIRPEPSSHAAAGIDVAVKLTLLMPINWAGESVTTYYPATFLFNCRMYFNESNSWQRSLRSRPDSPLVASYSRNKGYRYKVYLGVGRIAELQRYTERLPCAKSGRC